MKKIITYFVIVLFATSFISCGGDDTEKNDDKEKKDSVVVVEPTNFTDDRDGHVYEIVKIGDQTWMAENLTFKTDDGCYAYDDDENNIAKYGRLYNWETAKAACPNGWHLPSLEEWEILVNTLGGEEVAGGKLKSTSNLWKDPSTGDNSSKFSALPAGLRRGYDNFDFDYLGAYAQFWTSSANGDENAYLFELGYLDTKANLTNYGDLANGHSVRCIKD